MKEEGTQEADHQGTKTERSIGHLIAIRRETEMIGTIGIKALKESITEGTVHPGNDD
jgi:hypothetical protein